MATYYNLPVYKDSYDLLIELFKLIKEFSREYKYTIGETIKNETIQMIVKIYKANSSVMKKGHIGAARENLEIIRLLIRLLKDLKQINVSKFSSLNEKIETLSKQLTAWQNSQT